MALSIVTSFDKEELNHALVMIKSFSDNYFEENEDISLFCFVDEEIEKNKQEILNRIHVHKNIHIDFVVSKNWIDVKSDIKNSCLLKNKVWHKFFISSELKDCDNIIYVSPNSLFLRDVTPLLKYKPSNKFAARIDNFGWNEVVFSTQDRVYYETDVFYTSLSFWREKNIEKWVVDYLNFTKINPMNMDQDLFNIFFDKDMTALPYHFCYGSRMNTELYFGWQLKNPLVISFSGRDCPWIKKENYHHLEILWNNYHHRVIREEKVEKSIRFENTEMRYIMKAIPTL